MRFRDAMVSVCLCAGLVQSVSGQVQTRGEYDVVQDVVVTLRLVAGPLVLAEDSQTVPLNMVGATNAVLSEIPAVPDDIIGLRVLSAGVDEFLITMAPASLNLLGVSFDLAGFEYEKGPCAGEEGRREQLENGPGVFVSELGADADVRGTLTLSGGVPPFAFDEVINFADVGPSDLDLIVDYVVTAASGTPMQQLTVFPFQFESFTFGGFEFELSIELADGAFSIVDASDFLATVPLECCEDGRNVGRFAFDPTTIDDPAGPRDVITGDWNNDGFIDLFVSKSSSSRVQSLLGRGDGTFDALPERFGVSSSTRLVTADIDSDNDLDVISVQFNDFARFWINDGAGTFSFGSGASLGDDPSEAVTADVNGDSILDLLVTNRRDDTLSVLLGDGVSGFGPRTDFAAGNDPRDLAVGDVNGDLFPDVVTANRDLDAIAVLLNDGSGTFGAPTFTFIGDALNNIDLGDVDGDGDLDVFVLGEFSDAMFILKNDGTGAFPESEELTVPDQPIWIQLADLDGDGDPDPIVTSLRADEITVFRNHDGQVLIRDLMPTVNGPGNGDVGDFDNDGDLDIVLAENFGDSITIFSNGCPFQEASCPGDFADTSGFGPPDGQIDFGDFFALSFLNGPCGAGTPNPDCVGDLADDAGFGPPDGQISFGDFFALSFLNGPCP